MRTRALWLYICLWGVWHWREEDVKVDENTYFSFSDKEKLTGLSAEVSFCWELWLTYGPLPRQTRWAVQCLSWVVPCLGIDGGRELSRWHEVEQVKLCLGPTSLQHSGRKIQRREGSFILMSELQGIGFFFCRGSLKIYIQKSECVLNCLWPAWDVSIQKEHPDAWGGPRNPSAIHEFGCRSYEWRWERLGHPAQMQRFYFSAQVGSKWASLTRTGCSAFDFL